jgi:hypothetical protein
LQLRKEGIIRMKLTKDPGTPHERVYTGFQGMDQRTKAAEHIAVCLFDGDLDLYQVEAPTPAVADELTRYYTDDYDRPPAQMCFYTKSRGKVAEGDSLNEKAIDMLDNAVETGNLTQAEAEHLKGAIEVGLSL